MKALLNMLLKFRALASLRARHLRPGPFSSSRRGAFSIIGDVLGGVALVVMLLGVASLGG